MDPLFGVVLADLDGQNLRFCKRLASPLVRKTKQQQQQQLDNYSDDCRRVSPAFDEIRTCGF